MLACCYAAEMHPWVWLNEPQHSAAVQAVCSLVYTVAAIVAGWFAAGAYSAASKQAQSATEQIELVRDQLKLARETAAFEVERLRAEKEADQARRRAAFLARSAAEDAKRPRFRAGGFSGQEFQRHAFRNWGATAALQVEIIDGDERVMAAADIVPAVIGEINVLLALKVLEERGYVIRFRSEVGSMWTVRVFGGNTRHDPLEEVIDVERAYQE